MRGRKGGREREQTLLFLNVGEVKINKDVVPGRGPLKVGFAEPAKYTDTQKHTHCVCVCVAWILNNIILIREQRSVRLQPLSQHPSDEWGARETEDFKHRPYPNCHNTARANG